MNNTLNPPRFQLPTEPRIVPAPPSLDYEDYHELAAEMRRLLMLHGADALNHPDYQAAWKESEEIKNRHGGMPPTE